MSDKENCAKAEDKRKTGQVQTKFIRKKEGTDYRVDDDDAAEATPRL